MSQGPRINVSITRTNTLFCLFHFWVLRGISPMGPSKRAVYDVGTMYLLIINTIVCLIQLFIIA
jgi:hypothetical protein